MGGIARVAADLFLEQSDARLTLYLRRARRVKHHEASRVRIVEGDVLDTARLGAAMAGQHVVYANLAGDLEALARSVVLGRLGTLLVQEHHEFDPLRFLAPRSRTPADCASFLGSQLDDPAVTILVAESGDAVIGYAYAAIEGYDYPSLRGPAGVLHDLIVDPQYRGCGVGRLLLRVALSQLEESCRSSRSSSRCCSEGRPLRRWRTAWALPTRHWSRWPAPASR